MSLSKILKGAANIFLDSYASAAKQSGNKSTYDSAKILKDMVNGKIDLEGNPIRNDEDDNDD